MLNQLTVLPDLWNRTGSPSLEVKVHSVESIHISCVHLLCFGQGIFNNCHKVCKHFLLLPDSMKVKTIWKTAGNILLGSSLHTARIKEIWFITPSLNIITSLAPHHILPDLLHLSGVFVCLRGESRQTNREDRLQRTVNYLIRRIVSLNKSKKLDQGLSLFEKSQAAEP